MKFKPILSVVFLLGVAVLSPAIVSNIATAAKPVNPPGCPDGWVPAPNPQLGCIPNTIKPKPRPGVRKVTNPSRSQNQAPTRNSPKVSN